MATIYKIQNTINLKLYIGSSSNIKSRFYNHKLELNKNKHHCSHLQNAYNKYGKENFIFVKLLECNEEEKIPWENFYLDFYKPEYNSLDKAYELPDQSKSFTLINPNGVEVEGKQIKEFCERYNLSRTSVSRLIIGKQKSHRGWTSSIENHLKLKKEGDFRMQSRIAKVKSPNGEIYEVMNRTQFSKIHNLNKVTLGQLISGNKKSYKGWTTFVLDT